MSSKDLFLDFINLIFIILIIAFSIIFFINGNHFQAFVEILKVLAPLSLFGILLLIKLNFDRYQRKKLNQEHDSQIVLYINYWDITIFDIINFLIPIGMIVIPIIFGNKIGAIDIIEASFVFIILYFWGNYFFKKRN